MQLENSRPRSGTTARFVRTALPPVEPVARPVAAAEDAHLSESELLVRMNELEELATLACEANERLEEELATAREQLGTLQRMLEETAEGADAEQQQLSAGHGTALAEFAELHRELEDARDQVVSLQRLVVELEESAASAESPPTKVDTKTATALPPVAAFSAPTSEPVATAVEHVRNPFAAPQLDEQESADADEPSLLLQPPRRGFRPWMYIAGALVVGGAVAALLSPGAGHQPPPEPIVLHAAVAAPPPATQPAIPATTAPATPAAAKSTAPIAPTLTIPAAVPVRAATTAHVKSAPAHRAIKRNRRLSSKRKSSAITGKESAKRVSTDDPLGGLKM